MSENNTNPMPADLLNQILAEIRDMKAEIGNINTRLERVEARQMETNKLDKIIGDIAELRNDLNEFKRQHHKDLTEIKKALGSHQAEIADHELRIVEMEEKNEPRQ